MLVSTLLAIGLMSVGHQAVGGTLLGSQRQEKERIDHFLFCELGFHPV